MTSMSQPPQNAPIDQQQDADLQSALTALQEENQVLKHKLAWFERQLFGTKSEKRLIDDPAQTGLLFGETLKPTAPAPTEAISYTRRKPKDRTDAVTDAGLRFDDTVPVETIEVSDAGIEAIPPEHRKVIGEKVVNRLAQRPGSYLVLRYVRKIVKDARDNQVHTPDVPANVLERSVADVSFLAGMLVDKFVYHLPLYRQHLRLKQSGITISRTTLTNQVERAIGLLQPIHDAQLRNNLKSRVLAMDETPIRAGPSKKTKGKMHQGWYWPIYGQDDEVSFIFSPSRGADVVKQALGEQFEGVLVTDGYAAYGKYAAERPQVTAANCWAHTRRQFERAKDIEPAAVAEALDIIGALYRVERKIKDKGLEGEAKLQARSQHARPVVDQFWAWCDAQRNRMDMVPSNPLAKALKYALERVAELLVFLSDPDVPIDTNHLERALRPIPMGRKNWLFCWSEVGARHVGVIQSLMTTCRLHEINPYTYLVDVLQRVSDHPASQVELLTPRLWKEAFGDAPLQSDIDRVRQ